MTSLTRFSAEESRQIRNQSRIWLRLLSIPLSIVIVFAIGDPPIGDRWWTIAILFLLGGYGLFCWTSIFHETAHQTLFAASWANVLLGRALGTLMFVPYSVYRQVHIRHHAYLNRPEDWELWPYASPQASLSFRRAYVWFDLLMGIPSSALVYGRIFFHRDSPLRDRGLRRAIAWEYATIIAFWTGFIALNVWEGTLFDLCLSLTGTLFVAGALQTGRKLTEHLGMPSFDPLLGTRTVMPSQWLLQICSFFHFDIFVHGPHHRHPRATHGSLRTWMREYQRKRPELPYPVFASYWSAVRHMAPSLWNNPGCGLNAGALPEEANLAAVNDFLTDSLVVSQSRDVAEDESALARSA